MDALVVAVFMLVPIVVALLALWCFKMRREIGGIRHDVDFLRNHSVAESARVVADSRRSDSTDDADSAVIAQIIDQLGVR